MRKTVMELFLDANFDLFAYLRYTFCTDFVDHEWNETKSNNVRLLIVETMSECNDTCVVISRCDDGDAHIRRSARGMVSETSEIAVFVSVERYTGDREMCGSKVTGFGPKEIRENSRCFRQIGSSFTPSFRTGQIR